MKFKIDQTILIYPRKTQFTGVSNSINLRIGPRFIQQNYI